MLAAVFRFKLPEISTSPILQDLLRSFKLEVPIWAVRPPPWDLEVVLRSLTKKTLFFISLATDKWVSELQALSKHVTFFSSGACLAYVPEFVAKTELAVNSLPRSFMIKSLADFAAGLDQDLLLCPVRALREYLNRTVSFVSCLRRLFASPCAPSRAMLKNGISYLLRKVIVESSASSEEGSTVKAHSVRGIATSSTFFKNWSIASVLDAACWKSNSVFTLFYFRDLQFVYEGLHSLRPFIAAGEQIG